MAKGQHFLYIIKSDSVNGLRVRLKEYVYSVPKREWKWNTIQVTGGGYDMLGAVLGKWVSQHYQKELRALYLEVRPELIHVLWCESDFVWVNGDVGISNVYDVIEALGMKIYEDFTDKGIQTWFVLDKEEA